MTPVLATVVVTVIGLTSLLLFAYGLNMLYLSWRSLAPKPPPAEPVAAGDEPLIAVQLPIYNERYVAERIIDAAAGLEWPRDRLQVQVLDDSDDETVEIVAARVRHWRRQGVAIEHVRRPDRSGYKAGALAHGLALTEAPFVAVFDADFAPRPDFLRRLAGEFADPRVGFAQARWGHLNEGYSLVTRLQALSIDFHFLVEQAARSAFGCLTNFTGTAGIWRREAIVAGGGWSGRTLTEDLDLSYRAQLAGWKPVFREDLEVPEELPVAVDAYRRQQARWATGSFQCAFLLTGQVLRSPLSAAVKWQALIHLYSYSVPLLMLVQVACYPLLLLAGHPGRPVAVQVPLALNLVSLAPSIAFTVAQARRGRPWWHGAPGVICQVIGAGLSVTVWASFLRALRPGGEFRRTPKYRIEATGQEWRNAAYTTAGDPMALLELSFGLVALALAAMAVAAGQVLMAVYSALLAVGFLYLGAASLIQAVEVLTVRRLGLGALGGLRAAWPVLALLAAPAALLVALAQWPDPFEDSFQHWLIAANLVQTGHLADPLFGMQDTWLPGFHFLAAGVLRLAGWHQMGALKLLNVGLALATLAVVYQLAENPRQGRLTVFLLALNPIFLLTATSVVAEPLMLLALTGAALAMSRRQPALAASLAVLAVLTGTKSWLWLLCAVAVLAGEVVLRRRAPARRPALAWVLPGVGLIVILQLLAGPASHSVARAAQEVGSAVARGDLAADPLQRGISFLGYFLLASLPIAVLAPLGLRAELRSSGSPRLRLLILPSTAYLAAVTVLVFAGAYSGSHRYYYLALPGLALLAAAGLDRHPAPLGALAAAAAGLVTVAFLPVFAGFSNLDLGLAAAGRAAGSQPGALLTDSPVAAYYSGKQPDRIFGSRQLPADQVLATRWLRDHGVGSAVLEDIDYYRVNTVYPGLARGEATPPFQPLEDQAAFNLPGGKKTAAYSIPPEHLCAWVSGEILADLNPADMPRTGKTAALQKGVVLETLDGKPVAGEGVGFGVPVVRYPDGDYFSGTATVADLSTPGTATWVKVFELDRLGVDSDRSFRPVASRGRVSVTYRVSDGKLDVRVSAAEVAPGYEQVVMLNEQSGRFDDFADAGQTRIGGGIGSWRPVQGSWGRFRSSALDMEWSLPALPGADFRAAREIRGSDIDFSGLEYVFGPGFDGASYKVSISKAR